MVIEGPYFVIRSVDRRDIGAILEVYRQCEDFLSLGPVPRASEEMVIADLELSNGAGGVYCGVFVDDAMVGVVDFVPANYEGEASTAYLALLMIAGCHRRRGLGKGIVRSVESEILKDVAIERIKAGVQVNNPSALAFWEQVGYVIAGGPELMPDTTTVYHLQKNVR